MMQYEEISLAHQIFFYYNGVKNKNCQQNIDEMESCLKNAPMNMLNGTSDGLHY